MSSRSKLLLIAVLLSSIAVAGCNPVAWWTELRAPEVFIPSDGSSVAELRGPARLKVWARGQDGKVVRGYVNANDRWLIGPPAPPVPSSEIGQATSVRKKELPPEIQ